MNTHDNGFDKAQRAYDNMMPPDDDGEGCHVCEGSGKLTESDCCGAPILTGDVCAHCKEHCDQADCSSCDGTGCIDVAAEKAEAYQEWLEKKADEARDEQLNSLNIIGSDTDRFLGNKEV